MQTTKRVKDPRKQRKRLYNAPAHLRHKLMAAPLAPELISSKGVKTLPVRKGDTVRIVRGDHAGFEGKVNRVDLKEYRIFLEGLTREKVDGTNIFLSVHPSKVVIKNLKLDDKWRKAIVEYKKGQQPPQKEEKTVTVAEKPAKKTKATKTKKEEKEKPTKEKAEVQEKPAEKAPAAAKKRAPRKPAAKKEEKPAEKEKKPKTPKSAAAKKPRAKRKAVSKTKGGT